MKKLLIFLFLAPLFVFGQTKLNPNQLGSGVNKVFVTDANGRGKSDSLDWVPSTKTFANGVQSANHSADTLVWAGNSLTAGYSLPNKPQSTFVYQVSTSMGYKSLNLGVSGSTVGGSSPPYKYTHRKLLFMEFGFNDAASLGTDTATFHSNYNTYVNTAITRGWVGNQLMFLSVCGVSSARANATTLIMYNTVISQVAAHYGGTYIDVWNPFQLPVYGGYGLLNNGDQTHPNGAGSVVYAQIVKSALNSPNFCFDCTTPSAAINTIEANNLYLKNTVAANYGSKNLSKLMLDSLGRLVTAPLRVLPDSTITGQRFIFTGSWFQATTNAFSYLPASGTGATQFNYSQDMGILQGAKFVSGVQGGVTPVGTYTLNDASGHIVTHNYFSNGHIKFFVSNGSNGGSLSALDIDQSGVLNTGAAINIAQNADLQSGPTIGTTSARITTFTNSGQMTFTNYYQPGPGIKFFTAPVTSGTVVQALWIPTSGDVIIGSKTQDDGYGFNVQNTSKFENTVNFGIVAIGSLTGTPTTSTTGGALAAGTYYYKVVGVDANGFETSPYTGEYNKTTTGTTSTVTLPTLPVPAGTVSYHIYVGTSSNGENKYFTSTSNTGVTDIGSGYTTQAVPTKNQTSYGNISSTAVANFTSVITRANPAAINATATATAAQFATGYITSTSAAATTITTPTATALATQMNAIRGTSYYVTIDNTAGANTVTLALDASFTLLPIGSATMTVPTGTTGVGTWKVTFVSATAATISRIE